MRAGFLEQTTRYAKPLLIILLNVSLVLWIIKENYLELSGQTGFLKILSYVICISLVQSAILIALERRNEKIAVIVLMAFAAFNFFSIAVIHVPAHTLVGSTYLPLLAIPVAVIAVVAFFDAWKQLLLALLLFLVLTVAQTVLVARDHSRTARHLPDHLLVPNFEEKPNIYLISYDALIPKEAARKFLGIDPPKYIDALERHDLREVKHAFAAFVPSSPSLNSIVAMDRDFYNTHPKNDSLVAGVGASPLYEIMRKNGYKTKFYYSSAYFGPARGPYLDVYLTPGPTGGGTICHTIESRLSFLGYCYIEYLWSGNRRIDSFFDVIEKSIASESPVFTIANISLPLHTKLSYDTYSIDDQIEYRKKFLKNSKKAYKHMNTLIETIKRKDPDSILIIFGDHGTWISRTWNKGAADGSQWTAQQVMTERHLVALYVYPKTFCADEIKPIYELSRLGRSISKCLSDGRDPFPGSFQSNDDRWLPYTLGAAPELARPTERRIK